MRGEGRPLRSGVLCAWIVFLLGVPVVLAQACVPLPEFLERGDDAFYYFKVAADHPELGFWSLDGTKPTNGVQPLWALLLTGTAYVLNSVGLEDRTLLARCFVLVTAAMHALSAGLLFLLLRRTVSLGSAVASAGATLFPLGFVWGRTWGMESALYAVLLLGTIAYFHLAFLLRPSSGRALVLGLLLGCMALARLNAALFPLFLLGYFLLRGSGAAPAGRWRLASVSAAAAALPIAAYVTWNLATTGHLLPVSGAAKLVRAGAWLEERGIEARLSLDFAAFLWEYWEDWFRWFVRSRTQDGLWLLGLRYVEPGTGAIRSVGIACGVLLLLSAALGGREGLSFLRARMARLAAFSYVLAFGICDALLSAVLYPSETYATIRWWLVPLELAAIVVFATFAASCLSWCAARLLDTRTIEGLAALGVLSLGSLHTFQMATFYWDGEVDRLDWNLSWNEESYEAARWINAHLPTEAVVGSWNAGILGYYAERPVVNLDGLMNDFEFLPYLEQGRVAEYVRERGITHLSDMSAMFQIVPGIRDLELTAIHRSHSDLMNQDYRVMRVDG